MVKDNWSKIEHSLVMQSKHTGHPAKKCSHFIIYKLNVTVAGKANDLGQDDSQWEVDFLIYDNYLLLSYDTV